MKVAVFGPSGMLGKHVMRAIKERGDTPVAMYKQMYNLLDARTIARILDEHEIDSVINCAGIIPVKSTDPIEMIDVNSKFPHVLARAAQPRLVIHISTDCVFSGRNRYRYTPDNIPDPRDYYGKSKALGEVAAPNVCNVRTSFIGCEHGLMNWLLSAARSTTEAKVVKGYKGALWSGSTVTAVAASLANLVDTQYRGVIHLSTSEVISKHDLLLKLIEVNELDVQVEPVDYPIMNRALVPTVVLPDIDTALNEYKCIGARDARNSTVNVQPTTVRQDDTEINVEQHKD